MGWSKGNAVKASFLPAFHETLSQLPNLAFSGKFQILDENDIVFDGYDYYMLTKEPIQGLTLNKIAINGDESIATAIAEIRGYINMEFIICKLYLIGRVKKYLTSMWVGYGEEKESGEPVIFFAPIFPEDVAIFQEYDVNEIAREGMDEGETFIHGNKLWQVAQDDEVSHVAQNISKTSGSGYLYDHSEIHTVQLCLLCKRRTGHRHRCGPAVQDSLYTACRTESR